MRFNCEQRLLFPERIPKWEMQKLPYLRFMVPRVCHSTVAALGALISITYAWNVKDEELSSSPPRGARIHGLPVRADLSLEASCRPIHTDCLCKEVWVSPVDVFFLLYAAWVRSRAERPSVSYTKVVMEVAWTGHNLQFTKTN